MSGSVEGDRTNHRPEDSDQVGQPSTGEGSAANAATHDEDGLALDEDPLAALNALTDSSQAIATNLGTPLLVKTHPSSLILVETAFLASAASLLWLASYYLSLVPWLRILFPAPIALVYLRWGNRAGWMAMITAGLLLSVLMGPYLSLLFILPYGLLGVQLGALWRRRSPWLFSISMGTLIATFGFFFRVWILSIFLDEDLWAYITNRIADFIEWLLTWFVNRGILGIGVLGQTDLTVVQLVTILVVFLSDFVYLFTVHLAAWLLLERLGNPIPDPPKWVQVLMEDD